jgi:hypothetical protein
MVDQDIPDWFAPVLKVPPCWRELSGDRSINHDSARGGEPRGWRGKCPKAHPRDHKQEPGRGGSYLNPPPGVSTEAIEAGLNARKACVLRSGA